MFLCINLDDFQKNNLLINNKIRNNIITNSYFYRLYYSDNDFISNGIVICFNLNNIKMEKYFNKTKIMFNINNNLANINKLNTIEQELLSSLNIENKENKRKKCLIKEQLEHGFIKLINDKLDFKEKNVQLVIKISGLWESKNEYGLTFRCMKVTNKYN